METDKEEKKVKKSSFQPEKMSNKQLLGELRRRSNRRPSAPYLIDQVLATALSVVFENHMAGKGMRVGG